MMLDVLIVGGSAAGLSAAIVLGRSRRRVAVYDAGTPRNAVAAAAHGFFTRDGTPPAELIATGRAQLAEYGVPVHHELITHVERTEGGFVARSERGTTIMSQYLILATGVRDILPDIPGLAPLWGSTAIHCPYCHGWEVRDQPFAVLAGGEMALTMARMIRNWSGDVAVCTNGELLTDEQQQVLGALEIPFYTAPIARLDADGAQLTGVVFADGAVLPRSAAFVRPAQQQRSTLPAELGCAFDDMGFVVVDAQQQTSVPGVYAAGDMTTPLQQIVFASAGGSRAAAFINHAIVLGH